MSFISKLFGKKSYFPTSKHAIEEAFTIGGKKFFCFSDPANIPLERGRNFLLVWEEMGMKCTAEYLKQFQAAMKKTLTGDLVGSDKFLMVHKLNDQLGERLTYAPSADLIYKVAGVFYFSEDDKPEQYEPDNVAKNIALWKKHEDATAFFLRLPMQKLIPYLQDSDMSSQIYSGAIEKIHELHNQTLALALSRR